MPDTLRFEIIPVTPLQQNCTLLICPASNTAALVDPGGDVEDIVAAIERHGARLEKIFLTHGHLDHVGGTVALRDRYGVPVEGPHPDDAFWIDGLPMQAQMFGFPPLPAFTPDRWLEGGDTVCFGQVELAVRHCPGHTPGHVVFFDAQARLALVGDVLFAGSIGRTDLPRGNHADLLRTIREQLWPLGNDVRFIPGHGPMSTFGAERRSNPFVADSVLARG
ncbi:MBL fold metallo-hydrolase [Immundisolibacter cernigliae]|uniref:MBL fold metallo-hydrolase n=1 Tax=Immundisolibacter cernigliae TaxID=1810504 RepID=A0A1B1YUQ8_9GAMM|nr:MBL fold metallo-hydrolase [Immundisolibacter cernigliae]ANX04528.1 MBL fold metallo-hydrolase [Immundisolibacter cernigliae]